MQRRFIENIQLWKYMYVYVLYCCICFLQELCLNIIPTFADLIEYTTLKKSLIPRIKKLCLGTSVLTVKNFSVSALKCHVVVSLVTSASVDFNAVWRNHCASINSVVTFVPVTTLLFVAFVVSEVIAIVCSNICVYNTISVFSNCFVCCSCLY